MNKSYTIIKRVLDFSVSMVGIFICMPIFTLIYFIIRLDSEGPGIFIQDRVGLNGQVFKMYKFRTMVKNAEELKSQYSHLNETNSPLFKIKNDPRLTRVGNFLRNSNLDELPQLVNVLKGQMSLVGPRPFLCAEFPQFEPWQKERLKVRSGMTSFWHVYGRQILPVDFQSWVESDLEYTKKMNLLLDFKIVMKTIFMVFNHINNMVFLRLRK